jgi:PAS domain S-box-containing protein
MDDKSAKQAVTGVSDVDGTAGAGNVTFPVYYSMNLKSGSFDYVSDSSDEMLGVKSSELRQLGLMGFEERVHFEDRERLAREYEERRDGDMTNTVEYRFRGENGKYRWVRDSRNLVYDECGGPAAIAGVLFSASKSRH